MRMNFLNDALGRVPEYRAIENAVRQRKTPVAALVISAVIGICIVAVMHDGDLILNVAVFGACMSYALMNLSHILLRKNAPNMERGYRTPGGVVTTGIAFVLSCIAIVSTFFVDMVAACAVLGIYIVGLIYFRAYARKRIVGNAPEEEFAALTAAEAELR